MGRVQEGRKLIFNEADALLATIDEKQFQRFFGGARTGSLQELNDSARPPHSPHHSLEGLAKLIDHTALKRETSQNDIERLCMQAKEHGFAAVCVSSRWQSFAKRLLERADVKVCVVHDFPMGASDSAMRVLTLKHLVDEGADEIDTVVNLALVHDAMWTEVYRDMVRLRESAQGVCLKFILESEMLSRFELIMCSRLAVMARVDFIKTSTGFFGSQARTVDVKVMREAGGGHIQIKASGGIATLEEMRSMVAAGASRLGMSKGAVIFKGNPTGRSSYNMP